MEDVPILPCIGCSGYPIDDKRFLILGGIHDNEHDLLEMNLGIRCL